MKERRQIVNPNISFIKQLSPFDIKVRNKKRRMSYVSDRFKKDKIIKPKIMKSLIN